MPAETVEFMNQQVAKFPTEQAVEEMNVDCWTGLRCTEGRTRTDFLEVEGAIRTWSRSIRSSFGMNVRYGNI